jgi:protein-L-isoaspartate(D-aspartate) O-methyltransferase
MIEQQIRPWEVLDQHILDLLLNVPREQFVPKEYQRFAFADTPIPLAHAQVMMSPIVEARLLQALMLSSQDRVLEIGTGSGYLTALLAKSVRFVDSIDIFEDFSREAKTKLDALDIRNVALHVGDAMQGWNTAMCYDVIVLTGSVPKLMSSCQTQLNEGGCLLAIVGEAPVMQAQRITRVNDHELITETLFETYLPPLIGAVPTRRFIL